VAALTVLVDYDNVDKSLHGAGPVSLAKVLSSLISSDVLSRHTNIDVRLYGGWRSNAVLTRGAQNLVPDLRANSPSVISYKHENILRALRINVSLADKPIGGAAYLEETLVKNRGIRNFRSATFPHQSCSDSSRCGLTSFSNLNYRTNCGSAGCTVTLGDIFVRDEQKMVDTLLVADIAQLALAAKSAYVVIVSSDVDMWPGVLLALRNGCSIIHIHTKQGWRTQRHLMNTLPHFLRRNYTQLSV
jgi:hypothetical protein